MAVTKLKIIFLRKKVVYAKGVLWKAVYIVKIYTLVHKMAAMKKEITFIIKEKDVAKGVTFINASIVRI